MKNEVTFVDYVFSIRIEPQVDGSFKAFMRMNEVLEEEIEVTHHLKLKTIVNIFSSYFGPENKQGAA